MPNETSAARTRGRRSRRRSEKRLAEWLNGGGLERTKAALERKTSKLFIIFL